MRTISLVILFAYNVKLYLFKANFVVYFRIQYNALHVIKSFFFAATFVESPGNYLKYFFYISCVIIKLKLNDCFVFIKWRSHGFNFPTIAIV